MQRRSAARFIAGAFALVLAVTIGGCGSDDNKSSSSGAGAQDTPKAQDTLKIGIGGNYLANNAGLWAAHEEFAKLEDKYKTTIEFEQFGKGSDALAAVLGGSVNFCVCGPSNGLIAAQAGQKVEFVSTLFKGAGQLLIGAKKYEDTYGTDVKKYKGKSIGFTAPGSFSYVVAQAALENSGLPWKDVKELALGSPTAFLPALQKGRVDFAVMDIPGAVAALDAGVGYVVSDLNDPATGGKLVGDILGNGITFPEKFTDKYPDLSQDIVTAYIKGLSLVRDAGDNAKAVYALMPEPFKTANPEDAFLEQWGYLQPSFAFDGVFNDAQIEATLKLVGADPSKVPDGFFDASYADKAYAELGIQRPSAG